MTGTGPATCSIATRRPNGTTDVEDGDRDASGACTGRQTGRREQQPAVANADTVAPKGERVRLPGVTDQGQSVLSRFGITPTLTSPGAISIDGALTAPRFDAAVATRPALQGRIDAAFSGFERPALVQQAHYRALAESRSFQPNSVPLAWPTTRAPTDQPPRVDNPTAARSMDAGTFRSLVEGGRMQATPIAGNERLRTLASDTGYAYLERKGSGAHRHVSRTVMSALNLDADTRRNFQRQGIAALSEAQRSTLRTAIADERMGEISRLAGRDGVIPANRAGDVFSWIDRFDADGRAGSIGMVRNAPAGRPTSEATLTASGEALQQVLANTTVSTPITVKERDFVGGFRNGTFDAAALANLERTNPDAYRALDQAGILPQLRDRLAGGSAQLTVPQLRTLFRAADQRDDNGSRDSFVSHHTTRTPSDDLPFNVSGGADRPTDSGRIVAGLNAVFRSNLPGDPDQPQRSSFDPPLPDPNYQGNILSENEQRLSERASVDRDAFRDYMQFARINIAAISPQDREALAQAGLPWATVQGLARPPEANNTIGGPNSEMSRLYSTLQGIQGGDRSRPLGLYEGQFNQTRVGRVVEILDRYTQRHDIRTPERLAEDVANSNFHLTAADLDRRLPRRDLVPGVIPNPLPGDTVRERLRAMTENRFDVDGFAQWMNADPQRRQGRVAATELYRRLATLPSAYNALDPHNGTISLGHTTTQGRERSMAGQVMDFMREARLMRPNTHEPRAYSDIRDADLARPDEMATINLTPGRLHYMRAGDDCLLRSLDDVAFRGAAPGATPSDGRRAHPWEGHWVAQSEEPGGRIGGNPEDFRSLNNYLNWGLRNNHRMILGVARNGGTDVNRDGITDHWFTVIGRDVDTDGRVRYHYSENASGRLRYVGYLYRDRNSGLLFAPSNARYTVGSGGYQVTSIRGQQGGDWRDDFAAANSGIRPRSENGRRL